MRTVILIAAALALTACGAGPGPERPECAQPVDKPANDGGIGGTGNQEDCEE